MLKKFGFGLPNREEKYQFDDLRTIRTAEDEEEDSPESFIVKELSARRKMPEGDENMSNRVRLKPLVEPFSPAAAPKRQVRFDDKESDMINLAFDASASNSPAEEKQYQEYKHQEEPASPAEIQATENPSPENAASPADGRFLTSRWSSVRDRRRAASSSPSPNKGDSTPLRSKSSKDVVQRTPLTNLDYNSRLASSFDDSAFHDDDIDVEELFSKIRHNRIEFVTSKLREGCDPRLMVCGEYMCYYERNVTPM
jgi:hypothetical protein